ncbi:cell division protein PerM [Actinocorallia populi]|uniref:cell division protein PerM n=1 Tax=Actinocorallia populi TaxID=2079200 RepID=UPI0013005124|nr:DUF6350 family protein [Actinocorallia populi]
MSKVEQPSGKRRLRIVRDTDSPETLEAEERAAAGPDAAPQEDRPEGPGAEDGPGEEAAERPGRGSGGPARPLAVTGMVAAAWCVGLGLVVLMTITLVGWIAAPRTALGPGLPGVFRTAVNFWLVAHHAGFTTSVGRVGMLPLGLILLPAGLLYRGGGWIIRAAEHRYRRRIGVVQVALLLAAPYATFAVMLALIAGTPSLQPSPWQAFVACFSLAFAAGGLGAARAIAASRGRVRSGVGALLRLLPDRPRSVVTGVLGALAVLTAAGAVLVGGSLAYHHAEAADVYRMLAPDLVGGGLLVLVEIAYLPNAVIWGMSFAIGPGFSVGAGTSVSPTGVFLGALPSFPLLAALPEPGPAPLVSLLALAAPFLAGAVGGALTVRSFPSAVYEAAPLWGFLSGVLTGGAVMVLAALSGGPLGGHRMATMGPSAWQIGLLATLEVGLAAACSAWLVNWWMFRERRSRRTRRKDREDVEDADAHGGEQRREEYAYDYETEGDEPAREAPGTRPDGSAPRTADPVAFVDPEPVLRRRD